LKKAIKANLNGKCKLRHKKKTNKSGRVRIVSKSFFFFNKPISNSRQMEIQERLVQGT
jgi:hypothetical protein